MVTAVYRAIHMSCKLTPCLPCQLFKVLPNYVEAGAPILKGLVYLRQTETSKVLRLLKMRYRVYAAQAKPPILKALTFSPRPRFRHHRIHLHLPLPQHPGSRQPITYPFQRVPTVILLYDFVLLPFEAETDESFVEHVPMLQQMVFHRES